MDEASRGATGSRASRFEAWYGRDEPPDRVLRVSTGDVALSIHGIDVRRMRLGDRALIDRVFVAVRDADWGTIPGVISDVAVGEDPDTPFRMTFRVRHEAGDVLFDWTGVIAVAADGELRYRMDGVAGRDFEYARMGICVLYPAPVVAGRDWTATTATGPARGTFPALIGPQAFYDGMLHAITPPFSALELDLGDARLALRFEGDLFETEDQRNWTDDSFKTYSTPIALGTPHRAHRGKVFHQQVVIRATPTAPTRVPHRRVVPDVTEAPVELSPGAELPTWPAVGLGGRTSGGVLKATELGLLRAVRPDHLRIELRPGRGRWRTDLSRAIRDARALDCALELALSLRGSDDPGLRELAPMLDGTRVTRVLAFDETAIPQGATPDGFVAAVRQTLRAAPGALPALDRARWFGGTDGWFAELNRDRPSLEGLDGLSWSMHPQVHASDEVSVTETLPAQATTVATARSFAGDRGLAVGPVTFQSRGSEAPDPRQATLFGASWALGSVASLVGSGAESVTWFETVGPRGLLDRADRPSVAGWPAWASGVVFPMWHVFADLGDRAAARLVAIPSPHRDVAALGLRFADRLRVLVANLRLDPVECRLVVGDAPWARLRVLDHTTFETAMRDPYGFRERTAPVPVGGGRVALRLGAFATAMVEAGNR